MSTGESRQGTFQPTKRSQPLADTFGPTLVGSVGKKVFARIQIISIKVLFKDLFISCLFAGESFQEPVLDNQEEKKQKKPEQEKEQVLYPLSESSGNIPAFT